MCFYSPPFPALGPPPPAPPPAPPTGALTEPAIDVGAADGVDDEEPTTGGVSTWSDTRLQ